jgi:hypothetical protein
VASTQFEKPAINFIALALLGTMFCLAVLGYYLNAEFNIQFTAGHALSLGAAASLALGALSREKLPLFLSAIFSALWVGLSFNGEISAQLLWLFPAFFVLQYYLCAKLRAPIALTLSCLTALVWISGIIFAFVQIDYIPMTLA